MSDELSQTQLEQRVRELEQENAALRAKWDDIPFGAIAELALYATLRDDLRIAIMEWLVEIHYKAKE